MCVSGCFVGADGHVFSLNRLPSSSSIMNTWKLTWNTWEHHSSHSLWDEWCAWCLCAGILLNRVLFPHAKNVLNESSKRSFTTIFEWGTLITNIFLNAPPPPQPHFPPTSPTRCACLLLAGLPGSMQVRNMNDPGLQAVLLGRPSVSTARMDEERQEGDETDSSSQPSSILPSVHPI